jgi:hypothetical protein
MAQQTTSMQIVQLTGVASNSKTVFVNPLGGNATSATIYNNDVAGTITVSTDSTGSPSISIAVGSSFAFTLSGFGDSDFGPWKNGDTMFNVSGAVTVQPIVVVTS